LTLPAQKQPPPIDGYRSWLHVLARTQMHPMVAEKLDASDIVQQTLLEAHRDQAHFQGESPAQMAGWLRGILAHNVQNALRDLRRAKRDVAKETVLDPALDRSGLDTPSWMAAPGNTPSEIAAGGERMLALSEGLQSLPDDQCQAIVLRYWQGLPLAEIAARMERTPASVAGLLHRGLVRLRDLLASLENPR
jgi:RNA polymerase sigma-70 factor (ECF subfamily)